MSENAEAFQTVQGTYEVHTTTMKEAVKEARQHLLDIGVGNYYFLGVAVSDSDYGMDHAEFTFTWLAFNTAELFLP